jgi:hypothetical protein
MRTTLTLEADVARTLKSAAHSRKISLKQAVNDALRAGLGMENKTTKRSPFRVKPHSGGFMPGLDPHKLNKLADLLEDESTLAKLVSR